MTVMFDRLQPCRLCGTALHPYYLNMDEMLYMCSNSTCTFPMMSEELSKYMVSGNAECGNNAVDELSQDPFFAEIFANVSSPAAVSHSVPSSRAVTPPYSSLSVSSVNDEEFTYLSTISSTIISLICIKAIENSLDHLTNSAVGGVFDELKKAVANRNIATCASDIVRVISEKILFSGPNNNNLPVSSRINQLFNRLLSGAPRMQSSFRVEATTSSSCAACGFSQTWTSQVSSLQLKSYKTNRNVEEIISTEACGECGSNEKTVHMTITKLADVLAICCHENASQEITSASEKLFTDFERSVGNTSTKYALTTIVKYDEHVRRLVVAVRKDSNSSISNVNNWLRFDSLESFISGRFTNPPTADWLTSMPVFLIWQRTDESPWSLSSCSLVTTLQSLGSSTIQPTAQVENPPFTTSAFPKTLSSTSSLSGVSTFASTRSKGSQKIILTPPTSSLKRFSSDRSTPLTSSTYSNSQFLQKSLELLSSHRKILERKCGSRAGSQVSSSGMSSSRLSSTATSYTSRSSSSKRSRLDFSTSQEDIDSLLR